MGRRNNGSTYYAPNSGPVAFDDGDTAIPAAPMNGGAFAGGFQRPSARRRAAAAIADDGMGQPMMPAAPMQRATLRAPTGSSVSLPAAPMDPYGGRMRSFSAPAGNTAAPGADADLINPATSAPRMSPETILRRQNMGILPRSPSPGSAKSINSTYAGAQNTATKAYALAQVASSAPTVTPAYGGGSASATLPDGRTITKTYAPRPEMPLAPGIIAGRQQYADQHRAAGDAALEPFVGPNNFAATEADRQIIAAGPQLVNQQVRSATLGNDEQAARIPLVPGFIGAQTGLTNAQANVANSQAGVNDARADYLPEQQQDVQAELTRHRQENQQLRAQLQRYQQTESRTEQVSETGATKQRSIDQGRVATAATQIYNDGQKLSTTQRPTPQQAREQAYDLTGLRGSPTTQPAAGATAQPPASEQKGTLDPGGLTGTWGGVKYQRGADGQYHKVAQPVQ